MKPWTQTANLIVLMKLVDWRLEKRKSYNPSYNQWCIQSHIEQILRRLMQGLTLQKVWQHPRLFTWFLGTFFALELRAKWNEGHLGVKTQTNNFWINSLILPCNRQFNSPRKCWLVLTLKTEILPLWFAGLCFMLTKFSHFEPFRILQVNNVNLNCWFSI